MATDLLVEILVVLAALLLIAVVGGFLVSLGKCIDYWPTVQSNLYSLAGDVINRINLKVYTDLDLRPSSSQIRLVQILPDRRDEGIRCKLVEGDWKTSTYEALSYAWGNAVLVRTIELNSKLFLIPGNLYAALQSVRLEDDERLVWIDALSINQRDHKERDHQVQQMRQIYANASKVLVSLGDGSRQVGDVFDYIKRSSSPKSPARVRNTAPLVEARNIVRELLGRPWWERIWVIQEVAVGTEIEMYCGPSSISWDLFCNFVIRRHWRPEEDDILGHALHKFVSRGLPALKLQPHLRYGLLDLAHEFRSREASNPRDKLYALLGLIPIAEDRGIIPDYAKPVREVFMGFVRSHINQYQSLAILNFAEYRGEGDLKLPTWCPNWTVQALYPSPFWKKSAQDLDMWLHESQDYYCAAGNTKASYIPHPNPDLLGLRGFVFDKILAIGEVATMRYKTEEQYRIERIQRRERTRNYWRPEDDEARDVNRFSNSIRIRFFKSKRTVTVAQ